MDERATDQGAGAMLVMRAALATIAVLVLAVSQVDASGFDLCELLERGIRLLAVK